MASNGDNPFTKKAKEKPKLKSFGSKAQPAKKISPFTAKAKIAKPVTKENPWTSLVQPRRDLTESINKIQREYNEAIKIEAKLFKVVDRLEQKGKTDTQKFYDAKHEWNESWRTVDRKYVALHNTLALQRNFNA